VNFSNPDMIGHLICEHFDETVQAVEVIDSILQVVIPFAESKGFHVVLTADHGNSDDFSPAHGSHDVLTTFLSPRRDLALRGDLDGKAKLFDLPWCILDILGVREAVAGLMADVPEVLKQQGLVGKSLVAFRE
jgi:2,3-bisphosphoglycerate-independent phosphoglycerate mutase